ncbi:MAG: hypothetical protein JWP35_4712 [Caulobacter sp.]|nr:hypothetical protein [Caulobacter sp.]
MFDLAILKIPAIGAAAAAAVGLMGGGAMRPDASQFERPGQTLVADSPAEAYGQPVAWTGQGSTPSYVVGTDTLRPVSMDGDMAFVPPADSAVYSAEQPLRATEVDWHPTPDTRPSPGDRAGAIRDAQATNTPITSPPPTTGAPADFPSLNGDTMRGINPVRDDAAALTPPANAAGVPAAGVERIPPAPSTPMPTPKKPPY